MSLEENSSSNESVRSTCIKRQVEADDNGAPTIVKKFRTVNYDYSCALQNNSESTTNFQTDSSMSEDSTLSQSINDDFSSTANIFQNNNEVSLTNTNESQIYTGLSINTDVFKLGEIDLSKSSSSSLNVFLTAGKVNLTDKCQFDCFMILLRKDNGDGEIWLKGSDVCKFLGYKKSPDTINKKINEKLWIKPFSYFEIDKSQNTSNLDSRAIFIHQYGLNVLIKKSRNELRNRIDEILPINDTSLSTCQLDATQQTNGTEKNHYKLENATLFHKIYILKNDVQFNCWILAIENKKNCQFEFWFKGKDIATFLEYRNSRKAIQDHIRKECRTELANLITKKDFKKLKTYEFSNNWHLNTTFINEGAMYSLINRSNKPEAVMFQDWVNYDVLTTLRRTGSYVMPNATVEQKQQMIESLQKQLNAVSTENEQNKIQIVQKDDLIKQLKDQNTDKNFKFEQLKSNLEYNKNLLKLEEEYNTNLVQECDKFKNEVSEMQSRVAVMPDSEELKHVFRLLVRVSDSSYKEYVFLRCQKRSLEILTDNVRAKPYGGNYNILIDAEEVPNAMNILPILKNHLYKNNITYSYKRNRIWTSYSGVVDYVMKLLENNKIVFPRKENKEN